MPWQEQTIMSLRLEFVTVVEQGSLSFAEACRRFGVSRPTGYKWWARYQVAGLAGLAEQSRRPRHSPAKTEASMEAMVLAVRDRHPSWGGRKIRAVLLRHGLPRVPSASTITTILRRHDRLDAASAHRHTPWQRFEHPRPNDLWQLDFKGHFPLSSGRCHPLSVLDDHSRYVLGLFACANQQETTVRAHLTTLFRRYGLPWRILTDNGVPWGSTQPTQPLTAFSVWLLRLGVAVSHGRLYHPQTQGKVERLHRTLKADLLQAHRYDTLTAAQTAFDAWRASYNQDRPHDALELAVPARRYQLSQRPFPETLAPLEYADGDIVRTVHRGGQVHYRGQSYYLSLALRGQVIALRPTVIDGVLAVAFAHHHMGELNLHTRRFTMQYGWHSEV
jgi:transposase InsO family protein